MLVVSTTLCYPSALRPTQGIFVYRRIAAINRLTPVRVVAPLPWFPGLVGGGGDQSAGAEQQPPVSRPRMFYLPGVLKTLDARFYARALRRALREIAAETRPDLIDAHFEWPDGVGAWTVAREMGLPFVCTLRGKLVSQAANPAKRRMIREMLLGADALIAVSRSLAELAEEVVGQNLAIRVIPNGVDSGIFHRSTAADPTGPCRAARAALGWCEQTKYVVSVGHLQELKGFHRLVEVWPEVRRRAGNVKLVLVGGSVGEPGYETRLRRRIEAAGLAQSGGRPEAVEMTGRVDPKRAAEMLNAADLFVLASRSEGWCNAIAESLACGCPVVATDVGGNREIVSDPALGRLVPFGGREALAEAVCWGLERRWDRSRIAKIGGRRDWQQVARECVDVFEAVLKQRRP